MSTMVVLGASPNPERYSFKAVERLVRHRYHVVAVGKQKGFVGDLPIITGKPPVTDVHSVLIYIAPYHQGEIADYVISLKPKRVIFNPGTENPELEELLESYNIKIVHDCSLVMLALWRF